MYEEFEYEENFHIEAQNNEWSLIKNKKASPRKRFYIGTVRMNF